MSSSDWVHCNKCFRIPNAANGTFFFSNCGHILCGRCCSSGETPSKFMAACQVCSKSCDFMEINRNLRTDIAQYFRNPSDLANQYMVQLKKVLDFQANNRNRLNKYTSERTKKMQKFGEMAQMEIKKRSEQERKVREERDLLQLEVEKFKAELNRKENELEKLKHRQQQLETVRSIDSGFGSLDRSFQFMTSTPKQGPSPVNVHPQKHHFPMAAHQHDFFGGGTAISPIIGNDVMKTPAMLGIHRKHSDKSSRRSNSANSRHKMNFDANIMPVDQFPLV